MGEVFQEKKEEILAECEGAKITCKIVDKEVKIKNKCYKYRAFNQKSATLIGIMVVVGKNIGRKKEDFD